MMMMHIPDILTQAELAECRRTLDDATQRQLWTDGRVTAGRQSAEVKYNLQLPEGAPEARRLGSLVTAALERHPLFISAALPLCLFPPLFNRYDPGHGFGVHIDNAIRQVSGTPHRIRADLSATLFLSAPGEYDGGELAVEDAASVRLVKLDAGNLILYPAGTRHSVQPVTRGTRLAAFFWIQSMVRDEGKRSTLFDLDEAIQAVAQDLPGHQAAVKLTGVYHNLLRRWADAS